MQVALLLGLGEVKQFVNQAAVAGLDQKEETVLTKENKDDIDRVEDDDSDVRKICRVGVRTILEGELSVTLPTHLDTSGRR